MGRTWYLYRFICINLSFRKVLYSDQNWDHLIPQPVIWVEPNLVDPTVTPLTIDGIGTGGTWAACDFIDLKFYGTLAMQYRFESHVLYSCMPFAKNLSQCLPFITNPLHAVIYLYNIFILFLQNLQSEDTLAEENQVIEIL